MTTNNAQALLEKLNGRPNSAVVNVAGLEFTFHRDDIAYDTFINEVEGTNKLIPMKDYLLTIVDRAQRDDLLAIINAPMIALQIVNVVNAVFLPKLEITLKN